MRHVDHNNVIECRCVFISNTRFCQSYGSPAHSLKEKKKKTWMCCIVNLWGTFLNQRKG